MKRSVSWWWLLVLCIEMNSKTACLTVEPFQVVRPGLVAGECQDGRVKETLRDLVKQERRDKVFGAKNKTPFFLMSE